MVPVASEAFPAIARRPLNSRLDTHKLRHSFGLTLPDWRVGMDQVVCEQLRSLAPEHTQPARGAGA
jgi:dTDP-4-dehydrorhamnose reductase